MGKEERRKGAVFTGKLPAEGGILVGSSEGQGGLEEMELEYRLGMRWQCIGTVRRPSLPEQRDRLEVRVGRASKGREGKIVQDGQDGLTELLGYSQMVKEFGPHLTGNGESLKDFEQVEQGKDVTC